MREHSICFWKLFSHFYIICYLFHCIPPTRICSESFYFSFGYLPPVLYTNVSNVFFLSNNYNLQLICSIFFHLWTCVALKYKHPLEILFSSNNALNGFENACYSMRKHGRNNQCSFKIRFLSGGLQDISCEIRYWKNVVLFLFFQRSFY